MGFIMTLMLWSHSPSITLSCLSSFFSSSSSSHLAVLLLCERDLVSGTQIAHRSMNTLPVAVQLKKCLPLSHLLCRRCWDHVLSETACQGRLSALDTHTLSLLALTLFPPFRSRRGQTDVFMTWNSTVLYSSEPGSHVAQAWSGTLCCWEWHWISDPPASTSQVLGSQVWTSLCLRSTGDETQVLCTLSQHCTSWALPP